jgi:hypothetical protein
MENEKNKISEKKISRGEFIKNTALTAADFISCPDMF